jgi:hypothetical protein
MTISPNFPEPTSINYLIRAADLKGKGELHYHNITDKGLQEKGTIGKVWAAFLSLIKWRTDSDVYTEAVEKYLPMATRSLEEYKNKFSIHTIHLETVKAIQTIANELLQLNFDKPLPFQKNIEKIQQLTQEIQIKSLEATEESSKEAVFQKLPPEIKSLITQPHIDSVNENIENLQNVPEFMKTEVFQKLPLETRKKLIDTNVENAKYAKVQSFSLNEIEDPPQLELKLIPDSVSSAFKAKRDAPKEGKNLEQLRLIKLDALPGVLIPLQFYKDRLERPGNFKTIITLGDNTYTMDSDKDGTTKAIQGALDFIKGAHEWVEKEFSHLPLQKREPIFLTILQNLGQGSYARSLEIVSPHIGEGKQYENRLAYHSPLLGSIPKYSLECTFEKKGNDELLVAGHSTQCLFYRDNKSQSPAYEEFYTETLDYKLEFNNFQTNSNVFEGGLFFTNACIEKEIDATVTITTNEPLRLDIERKLKELTS